MPSKKVSRKYGHRSLSLKKKKSGSRKSYKKGAKKKGSRKSYKKGSPTSYKKGSRKSYKKKSYKKGSRKSYKNVSRKSSKARRSGSRGSYAQAVGTKRQVWNGTAHHTSGGVTAAGLIMKTDRTGARSLKYRKMSTKAKQRFNSPSYRHVRAKFLSNRYKKGSRPKSRKSKKSGSKKSKKGRR